MVFDNVLSEKMQLEPRNRFATSFAVKCCVKFLFEIISHVRQIFSTRTKKIVQIAFSSSPSENFRAMLAVAEKSKVLNFKNPFSTEGEFSLAQARLKGNKGFA